MKELFSFGELYVSDFLKPDELPRHPQTELKLLLDDNGCVRLEKRPPLDTMWGKYWYRSGTNATMRNELKSIVDSITSIIKLKENDLWIDAASNDGSLLSFIPNTILRVGIDPAEDSFKKEAEKHSDLIIQDYFSAEVFKKSKFGNLKAKIITSIAMFYDLEHPESFINDVNEILDENGLWVLQLSYSPLMIYQCAFDNFLQEHFYYYSLFNLKEMFNKNGFNIIDCQLNDVNGGSFRIYAMKKTANIKTFSTQPYRDVCSFRVKSLLEYEKTLGLDLVETWQLFFENINVLKEQVVSFIKQAKDEGKTIWGYGACHDVTTKLVTENGIKNINEITRNDKVYSINTDTEEIELVNIDEIHKFNYEGEMIHFYGKRIDQLVTPNHKILLKTDHNPKLKFESAEDASKRSIFKLPNGHWIGINNDETIDIRQFTDQTLFSNKCRKIPNVFNTSDFMYLVGLFIGDGYAKNQAQGYSINFCIPKNDKARNRLIQTLKNMNLLYRIYDNEIQVASKALYNIMLEHCGKYAKNKHIPKWALEYSPKYLKFLLDGIVDSDGWYEQLKTKSSKKRFITVSPRLVKDSVELAVKLGYFPSITTKKPPEKLPKIGDREIKSSTAWVVNFATNHPHCYNNKKIQYNGIIWCLSVKNRNFLVERNGKICFSGNSSKGNTLLQYFGLDNTLIDGIAERSTFKWGLKTVGTNIPIYSEDEMRKAKPDYLLILPWHFINEFIEREKDFLLNGGKFIVPAPKFEIIGI